MWWSSYHVDGVLLDNGVGMTDALGFGTLFAWRAWVGNSVGAGTLLGDGALGAIGGIWATELATNIKEGLLDNAWFFGGVCISVCLQVFGGVFDGGWVDAVQDAFYVYVDADGGLLLGDSANCVGDIWTNAR